MFSLAVKSSVFGHFGIAIFLVGFLFAADIAQAEPACLEADRSVAPVRFAADEIRAAMAAKGQSLVERKLTEADEQTSSLRIVIATDAEVSCRIAEQYKLAPLKSSQAECYAIRRKADDGKLLVAVLGAGPVGAMYGGLDVAEAIRLGTLDRLADSDRAPHLERRGIKFNIPLDARTPSYSDNSDAAQQNIAEMWSMDFWREMLDDMARHRYNALTLWSLHPFPSLVKVPEFPEVALDDVMRTTLKMDDSFSHTGTDMWRPAMANHLEVVRRISIDEKIRFWRDVMQHAHDRGIEVYWFTWNLFTFGAEGKHGITDSQSNPTTIAYFRASVREMVLTYPLLAGFGITSGERMENRKDEFSKEKWLWKTYGEGVRDAVKLQPDRKVRLIHRYHQTGQDEILREWKDYPGQFDLSFKYAIAHMYSVPNPPYIKSVLPHLGNGLRTWLTVRNDDIYSFRWGDPEYARAFIRAIPGPDKVAGFYMGPDGYTWGREFLSKEPESPRELVIQKQWYSFMLWGRLSYDPDLPDELFRRTLAARFPQADAETLFTAWSEASKIFPQITRFFWGDIDLRWLPEACLSHPRHRGFYTVRHFIEGRTMPESGILNVLQWRDRLLKRQPWEGVTPLEVADALEKHAQAALAGVEKLRSGETPKTLGRTDKEYRQTLGDLEAFAHLGLYYVEKIRGACQLAMFDATGDAARQKAAIEHLQAAVGHWQRYADAYTRQYVQPVLYNRVGFIDLPGFVSKVEADVAIARDWKPGTIADDGSKPSGGDVPFRK